MRAARQSSPMTVTDVCHGTYPPDADAPSAGLLAALPAQKKE